MHLLTTLLLAHLLADFPLQTNAVAKLKRTSLTGVFIHVLIYVLITTVVIREPARYWALIAGLGGVHFLIDSIKTRYMHKQQKQVSPRQRNHGFVYALPLSQQSLEICYFVMDQCFHFLSIGIAAYLATLYYAELPQSILPYELTLVAVGFALLLGFMVFCWVWVNSLSEEQVKRHTLLQWTKHQMLALEQSIGLLLIGFIFAGPTYQWLSNFLHSLGK